MNIAYFLLPKNRVAYLYDDYTFRQGLEKMRHHGYTAIPVISKDGKYLGTVSEGDFLWRLVSDERDSQTCSMKDLEQLRVRDILRETQYLPVRKTSSPWWTTLAALSASSPEKTSSATLRREKTSPKSRFCRRSCKNRA